MFDRAREIVRRGVTDGAFPAAVVEVGDATRPLWQEAFGRLSYESDARPTELDTIFDLASLTKVLVTTPLVIQMVERGTLGLEDRVADRLLSWRGDDRSDVTVRDLLAHCSGLPAYLPLFRDHAGRSAFETTIGALPLEYEPRTASIYSDLGFMLLGFIVEDAGRGSHQRFAEEAVRLDGRFEDAGRARLDQRFETLMGQMGIADRIQFTPPARWLPETAPTSRDPWRGRLLVGEVDDENAHALGGIAGHAGLFGTAGAVGACARHVLQVVSGRTGAFGQTSLGEFIARRPGISGSSRALGWDTMLPASSCGTRMSPRAFGHTGFTGTSLWIDPDQGVYAVLLTNRVHPTRDNDRIVPIRPAFHDAVMDSRRTHM